MFVVLSLTLGSYSFADEHGAKKKVFQNEMFVNMRLLELHVNLFLRPWMLYSERDFSGCCCMAAAPETKFGSLNQGTIMCVAS